jgi:cell fate (sporulation/competence/biofilm development) regulator YmcA (YheA/YmcA/DUF963 family)
MLNLEKLQNIQESLNLMNKNFNDGIINFFKSFGVNLTIYTDKLLRNPFITENNTIKNTNIKIESLQKKEWYNFLDKIKIYLWQELPTKEIKLNDDYEGILVFTIEFKQEPKKMHIKEIARLISRNYYGLPLLIFFKFQNKLSIVNCERTNYKRKDLQNRVKIGKIYLLYNIHLDKPHAGHIRILNNFYKEDLKTFTYAYNNLHQIFETSILIDDFIKEIKNWYFYALDKIQFPNDLNINEDSYRHITLLRMISRIMFIWFLKEKGLIPESLFDPEYLNKIIKNFNKSTNYYNAILQNLFFATLNRPINERKFAKDEGFPNNKKNHGIYNLYRFENLFNINEEEVIELFREIPFLNGGLFECLDKEDETKKILYVDGFSRNSQKRAKVPDDLFFDQEIGLINILKRYVFTLEENTPLDVEVALDPELIGKVFENLLAYYLPETRETARKSKGAYYTPKEIVEFMVEESLKETLNTRYKEQYKEDIKEKLEILFQPSLEIEEELFTKEEKERIIKIISQLKIIDPAVGSGAFLQGILLKLVFLLQQLDPDNQIWKKIIKEEVIQKQIEELKKDQKLIQKISDEKLKEEALNLVENRIKEIEETFDKNYFLDDYARKLYLIENCLYGVDIEPIAIQLSKLRFFLTLVIDQKSNSDPNKNYGIRPLPNLETMLIAANSLIPLNIDQQYQIKNPQIEELEEKLKEIRQKHFNAIHREQKLKAREQDKKIREKLKDLLIKDGWNKEIAQKIADYDPYDEHKVSSWFDPEYMFGVKEFDIVIGNPPYISTKGISSEFKDQLEKIYGFADDTYNHFYFKGIDLLKQNSILSYISSKTFWTIQTKKNLREMILKNQLLILFDTANPFESPMVDTCISIIKKNNINDNYPFLYLDGTKDLKNPIKSIGYIHSYKEAPNQVFFPINDYNLKIFKKYSKIVKELLNQWWDKISTSKNIEKYKNELEKYRRSLKPGDITLLGLITEGGQGLATANNGKYVGVLEGTKWADNARKQRPEKLLLATEFCKKNHINNKSDAQQFLDKLNELEIRKLFDDLKEKYGRDVFGQGWLYRIVSPEEIADVETLTEEEKLNGIKGKKTFVPYDKGDKDGNRWYAPTPYYIDWSRENVKFLKENSGKKGEGMPVVRNPQFYFREGFCWTDVNSTYLKSRLKENGVYDVLTMSLFTCTNLPDWYFVCIINSKFISEYVDHFVNSTSHFQINDARQLPIIIPTTEQLKNFESIFNRAVEVQKQKFAGKISEAEAEKELAVIQKKLDEVVEGMYLG